MYRKLLLGSLLTVSFLAVGQQKNVKPEDEQIRKQKREASITIRVGDDEVSVSGNSGWQNDSRDMRERFRDQNRRIRELERAVQALQYRVYDLEDIVLRGYNPTPVYSNLPACELSGFGTYNYRHVNYIVSIGANAMNGTDKLDDALKAINDYQNEGLCARDSGQMNDVQCTLLGFGTYNYRHVSFRVALKSAGKSERVIFGADNQREALDVIRKVRAQGLCR